MALSQDFTLGCLGVGGMPYSLLLSRSADFDAYFATSLAALDEVEAAGFVVVDTAAVTVQPAGRLFVRNVCMAFDRYLEAKREANRPVFSRTV